MSDLGETIEKAKQEDRLNRETMAALVRQVDLLTENMMRMQQALLLTNEKLASFERRSSPLVDITGRNIRKQ